MKFTGTKVITFSVIYAVQLIISDNKKHNRKGLDFEKPNFYIYDQKVKSQLRPFMTSSLGKYLVRQIINFLLSPTLKKNNPKNVYKKQSDFAFAQLLPFITNTKKVEEFV